METQLHDTHKSNIINGYNNCLAVFYGNNNNININLTSGILTEFISYMNALPLEKQVKIIQFALKQKDNEKQVIT